MPLIVFTTVHPWIQKVVNEVKPAEFDVEFVELKDEARAAEILPKADFLVCVVLPAHQAKLMTNCKLVMHNGVGYDGIATDVLAEMGIPVAVTPAMTPEGVGEHTFMLILSLLKQLPAVQQSMRSGGWNMFGWREGSHNLAYKTLGIVGLGRIGKRVAHLAHAFDCNVIYNDIVDIPKEFEEKYDLTRLSLDGLLTTADIITLHVPLTDQTRKMITAAEFSKMKQGAIFINASRGETYDMNALYDAIRSGHLFGAGIDVYDPEPPVVNHPILQLPNVVCTPHIASGTVERQYGINRAQFENSQRVLAGKPPLNLI
ncbi:MAG: 2-hydroxyacid dehydrogenase [Chloroflexota bacterium]